MDPSQYTQLTKKSEIKRKPRAKPLPKATEKYLEAEETPISRIRRKSHWLSP